MCIFGGYTVSITHYNMDIQDLRYAYESADQQVNVLESLLQELVQRCERTSLNPETDFTYTTFKLKIMTEIKTLYEFYRDLKQEQYQRQCAAELTEILHETSTEHHHDNSMDFNFPVTSTPISDELNIHRVPSLLSPIDDPMFMYDSGLDNVSFSSMDYESDMLTDQLRDI